MLLAIDTSTAQVGLALLDGDRVRVESIWNSTAHHTVELAPAVVSLLDRAGASMGDVTAIGVAIGPGAFTALRVGLSLAKGLALAGRIPMLGVPTLDVLAAGQPPSEFPLAAVLEAGRGRLAVGWYKSEQIESNRGADGSTELGRMWVAQGNPQVMTVEALAKSIARPSLLAGELSAEDRVRLARKRVNVLLAPAHRCVRRPSVLAEMAFQRLKAGHADDIASLAPIYLHQTDPVPA